MCVVTATWADRTADAQTGQTLIWDANGSGSGVGGTGNWLGDSTWRLTTNTGALQNWGDGNAAEFDSPGGTVTVNGPVSVTGLFLGNGYTLDGSGTITLIGASPIIQGGGTKTIDANISASSQVSWNAGTLYLGGNNSFAGGIRILASSRIGFNTNTAGGTGSGAGTISISNSESVLTNSPALSSQTITVQNPVNISGTQHLSFGASGTSNTLIFAGQITGSGNVWITDIAPNTGVSGTGVTVFSNGANSYSGITHISNSVTGVLRLGANNALSPSTTLMFGGGGTSVGAVDLNGTNQIIAALTTNGVSSSANGITNTVGGTTSTLTINGSASTTYPFRIGVSPNTTNLAGSSNNIALTLAPTNTGSLTLTGTNTYTGATTISGGTLAVSTSIIDAGPSLAGTTSITVNSGGVFQLTGGGTNRIHNAATMTLNGGKFATAGLDEHGVTNNTAGIGALTLQSSSIIDMASGTSILAFANSSANSVAWGTGKSLDIWNWTGTPLTGGGTDQLYFGSDVTGLTASQLLEIHFYSGAGTGLYGGPTAILLNGEVVPIPESSTWIGGGLAFSGLLLTHRRRPFRLLKRA